MYVDTFKFFFFFFLLNLNISCICFFIRIISYEQKPVETVDNKIQRNKEAEGAINDKQVGVTRKNIDAQNFRDIATKACEISPAIFSSMASDQNVQGAETVSPDNAG
jgi:hypothetical protein